jgi:hypothetical protein
VVPVGCLEPLDDLLDGSYLRVKGGLLASEVAGALGDDRALSFVILRDHPSKSRGLSVRSVRPGVAHDLGLLLSSGPRLRPHSATDSTGYLVSDPSDHSVAD